MKVKRMTKQKKVIYDILCNTAEHPTAETIYNEAKNSIPDISLGTVYRNLQVLVDEGKAIELNFGKNSSRFDANTYQHSHLCCTNCGGVYDIELPENNLLKQMEESPINFKIENYRLEFSGICENCLRKMS